MIPKIIWQTHKFEYDDLPQKYKLNSMSWKQAFPDWEYRYFSDVDVENFIAEFYPDYLDLYKSIKPGMYRADFWRYLVVYKYGGMYADMDSIYSKNGMHGQDCTYCMDFVKRYPIDFSGTLNVCVEHETNGEARDVFTNAFFLAAPNDPVLKKVIDLMIYKCTEIANNKYEKTPDFVWITGTGPEMYTAVVNRNLQSVKLACFPVRHGAFYKDQIDIDIHLTWNIVVD